MSDYVQTFESAIIILHKLLFLRKESIHQIILTLLKYLI